MWLFGHLGIGSKIVSPFTRSLPAKFVFIGTMLPDIIDKPIYYGLAFTLDKHGQDLGVISGTRTFGHTALFLLILTLFAYFKKSRALAALALGVGSHLLLDSWSDVVSSHSTHHTFTSILLWPFLGWEFPPYPFHNIREHFSVIQQPVFFWSEIVGVILLIWTYVQKRFRTSIAN